LYLYLFSRWAPNNLVDLDEHGNKTASPIFMPPNKHRRLQCLRLSPKTRPNSASIISCTQTPFSVGFSLV